ncbi:RimL Acetyltransferases, including N-acetylases of ribosomal proteins [uncultured Caudovirales phage]|uniref:RimL Acetyltransferases, including N-acetylases of ribosomal proteins n=1 Tax=uncultured Caudovirales phage TaxID=2100421 RepID=A0A6J5NJ09_9CAUD|nr:RimL Acetyltransferases, including N-acetylases of ribosomal proteins [uncultured Caudovirales phage]
MALVDINQRQEYFDYMNKLLDAEYLPENSIVFASLDEDGNILGGVLFSQFTRNNCEVTCASSSPRFLNRNFMDVFFHYAFITAGKARVNAIVDVDNEKSKVLCRKIGFIEEGVLKRWYGDKDAVIFRMTREECRWIKDYKIESPKEKTNGKRVVKSSGSCKLSRKSAAKNTAK